MKKVVLFILLILLPVVLFADGEYFLSSSMTKTITAYKTGVSGTLPSLAVSLRLLEASQTEFNDSNYEIDVPGTARGNTYAAFSWILAGNAFGSLKLKFSFGQLSVAGTPTNVQKEYIPYDVMLVYGVSRVGNSSLQINHVSTATSYVTNNYAGTTYRFFYADSISGASSQVSSAEATSVSASSGSATVTYNMSTNTKVANSSGSFGINDQDDQYKTEYINAVSVSGYNTVYAVCDHWNRTGTAYVYLRIENVTDDQAGRVRWKDNTSVVLDAGKYYATITVEVSLE